MNRSLPTDDCWILRAPRLNANDDSVTLTRWLVHDGATVAAGQPVAEIETEKATAELSAERGGILLQAVAAGVTVPVGAPLAHVGATLAAAKEMRRSQSDPQSTARPSGLAATPKARALAVARGVDLAAVRAAGATIQERDVARHLAGHGAVDFSDDPRLELVGPASAHQLRVARDLHAAARASIFTTLAYRLDLRGPERAIAAGLARGHAASLLVLLLAALGRTLPRFPALVSVLARDTIYRWRDIDIAFAARSPAGDLHAPVVRCVDRMSPDEIARECA